MPTTNNPFVDRQVELSAADRAEVARVEHDAESTGRSQTCELSDGTRILVEPADDGSLLWYIGHVRPGGSDG